MSRFSFSWRVLLGVGSLLALLIAVGLFAAKGFNVMLSVSRMNELTQELLLREIDHLKWAKTLNQEVQQGAPPTVQKDHTKCNFGKWYYSPLRAEIEEFFPEIKPILKNIDEPHKKLHETATEIAKAIESGKKGLAEELLRTEVEKHLTGVQSNLTAARDFLNQQIKKHGQNSQLIAANYLKLIGIMIFSSLLIAALIWFVLNVSSIKPIKLVLSRLERSSSEVEESSLKISEINLSLVDNSEVQVSSSQETAAAAEELRAISQKNLQNSRGAGNMTSQIERRSEEGLARIEELAQKVRESLEEGEKMRIQIQETSQELGKIIDMISEITTKLSTIHEIVFQTKLLSFNASVEAARAGSAGAGFAVVADEVRSLAAMSARVANEIEQLVQSTNRTVQEIIQSSSTKLTYSVDQIQALLLNNAEQSRVVEQQFREIIHEIKDTTTLVKQISDSNSEQAAGIEEISKAMGAVEEANLRAKVQIDLIANTANRLNDQVDELNLVKNALQKVVFGQTRSSLPIEFDKNESNPSSPTKNAIFMKFKKAS